MPVYLCQPGAGSSEPWRHGIQVYAAPFEMDETSLTEGGRDSFVLPASSMEASNNNWSGSGGIRNDRNNNRTNNINQRTGAPSSLQGAASSISGGGQLNRNSVLGHPVRRVRHAEVVLVDDACIAFDRYWLRLRWPGHKGSFAGYIALGKVGQPGTDEMLKGKAVIGPTKEWFAVSFQ